MTTRQPPRFYGIDTYSDPQGRFRMRFPTTWQQSKLQHADGTALDGAMFLPDPDDPATSLSAWVSGLEHAVVAEDLEDLRQGVEEGLTRFPECRVESAADLVLSNLVKFERVFTYREDDTLRKRKFWMLYVDRWLIVVSYQGSSVEEYEYWLAMANYSYATFFLPEELWFATDRDLVGIAQQT